MLVLLVTLATLQLLPSWRCIPSPVWPCLSWTQSGLSELLTELRSVQFIFPYLVSLFSCSSFSSLLFTVLLSLLPPPLVGSAPARARGSAQCLYQARLPVPGKSWEVAPWEVLGSRALPSQRPVAQPAIPQPGSMLGEDCTHLWGGERRNCRQ